MNTGTKIAIGIGALGLVGGLTYYFVFKKKDDLDSSKDSNEKKDDDSRSVFSEGFYDNDWIEGFTNTATGKGIGYLVPSPTKFKVGDKIKVTQDVGATIPEYSGNFNVMYIAGMKKLINGVLYDSIGTDAKYLGNTPKNGGTITLIK
jgi:hypothetical protein